MKTKIINPLIITGMLALSMLTSCSLEEVNPGGFTVETIAASSEKGYGYIINNCYFGWQQRQAGNKYYSMMAEGGTDLWTYKKNDNSYREFFKYGAEEGWNNDKYKDQWHAWYDGIGYCNKAIDLADEAPFIDDKTRNEKVAEAYFMRAFYYYYLVEQFGPVTLILEPTEEVDLHPEKTDVMTIYEEVIIPGFRFAADWLPIENEESRPSRKTAIAFLSKAYLQSVSYDNTKKYASKALETAKILIDDWELNGGEKYNVYLYPTFDEVFDEANNLNSSKTMVVNREALWTHRFVEGGTPRNPHEGNETNELFYCVYKDFPAVEHDFEAWGQRKDGTFMPSHYLLKLFVQEDNSLDPRYDKSFQTFWKCNVEYMWTADDITNYDRTFSELDSVKLTVGDTAILFVHPNQPDYDSRIANKRDQRYLVVDLADVYNDTVRMKYTRVSDGVTISNPFRSFYPSLTKFNTSHNVEIQANKKYANENAVYIMRMAEVYLFAAEADIYVNGGANALTYINKIRLRAGANPLSGTPTIQTVLDERARELCGEFCRFEDLKRTGKLTENYLQEKNYDVGKYFIDNVHNVRPIPTTFLETIDGSGAYYQNPGYY